MNLEELDEGVKDALNKVLGTALGVAREQLEEQGVFLPFAIALEPQEGEDEPELRLIAVPPTDDPEDPEADIDTEAMVADLMQVLNQQGTHFQAIAVASDVLLQDNDQDAIHIVAEHRIGAALAIVQPYTMPAEPGGEWHFDEPAAESAEAIWANAL
ncbi:MULTISPECIES: hypothetical protein [Glutamicibacter]|uniref:Uncharacterized protein n=2 Tax=Glutamicibacter TaxID=1742989 RepID=A0ABX4N2N6_9MICC|nr:MULTISPECIES: hypothetical protein [Glutamicibacter]KWR69548.1 hypothetical protein RN04_17365 [Arthrobacter sp. W1]MDV2978959.1 hypothetical protein [Actinomycetes bacterium ARC8]PJJ45916.1 hypothetical protein ATK23_3220 [Glutamicibacter mysorens]QEP06227.1 hypothetical protein F0M17_02610 [Glutamicibacter sp. ZJUTW]RWZ79541.1 hypothetical protein EKH49_16240 [Glutamicibacter sp. HZAU]